MTKARLSELDLSTVGKLGVLAGSDEANTIDPRYLKIVDGSQPKQYNLSSVQDSGFPDVENEVYEKPGVPHMDDIKIIKNSTYVDSKKNVRTKIVLRIKNSSGESILGVDARVEVKTGVDQ
jgi:hypothetical protein